MSRRLPTHDPLCDQLLRWCPLGSIQRTTRRESFGVFAPTRTDRGWLELRNPVMVQSSTARLSRTSTGNRSLRKGLTGIVRFIGARVLRSHGKPPTTLSSLPRRKCRPSARQGAPGFRSRTQHIRFHDVFPAPGLKLSRGQRVLAVGSRIRGKEMLLLKATSSLLLRVKEPSSRTRCWPCRPHADAISSLD